MLTTCNNCKTRFRVSAAQLKLAGGQVRCSRCQTVFDAFEALEEEITGHRVPLPRDPTPEVQATRREELADVELSAARSAAPELDVALQAGTPVLAESPDLVMGAEKPRPAIDDLFAALIGDGPVASPGGGVKPPEAPEATQPQESAPEKKKSPRGVKAKTSPRDFTIPGVKRREKKPVEVILAPLEAPTHRLPSSRPRRTLLWTLGTVCALLCLLVQLANIDRDDLAQNPVIGPSLQALYAALGRPLSPPRDPASWGVDGINVTSDPQAPGALYITGSLENQAGYVQAWPLLRVVLTDRYGDTLRARDFKPDDYLPATQANVLLAAGQGTHFRLDVADPGADAVGFSVSPCLDVASTRVCATTEHE
jgi:predicted Zn finger-like uncharacterized protein